jgi:hypothetical protein
MSNVAREKDAVFWAALLRIDPVNVAGFELEFL